MTELMARYGLSIYYQVPNYRRTSVHKKQYLQDIKTIKNNSFTRRKRRFPNPLLQTRARITLSKDKSISKHSLGKHLKQHSHLFFGSQCCPSPSTLSLSKSMPRPVIAPQKRTHPLIWCAALICTVFMIIVIITGIVVFVGYLVLRPSVPFVRVMYAHLDDFSFDDAGVLTTAFTMVIRAENDNVKVHASFSDIRFTLSFDGLDIARLEARPFDVDTNDSLDLKFVFASSPIPLDSEQINAADLSLKENEIEFGLKGSTRARWRVGPLGSVKFWCLLNCQLNFQRNGNITSMSRCSSKSK